MDKLKEFLQQLKWKLQILKQQLPKLKWQLQNNKPLALLCVAVLGLLLFSGLKSFFKDPPSSDRNVITIEAHTKILAEEPMYKTVTLFGQVNAAAKINVVNKYAGMILEVRKDLGDKVTAGDVLAQQDLKDINVQIARADADFQSYDAYTERYDSTFSSNFQKYQSEYSLKKTNYERYAELFKKGAVSKLTLDEAEQQMLSAKASLESLTSQKLYDGKPAYVAERAGRAEYRRNTRLLLENQREDMTIKAPREGIISFRNAEAGSYVQAGTHLFTIVDNSSLNLDCYVSEFDAALLQTGETVSVAVESLGNKYNGRIIFVSPDKNKDTKNYLVRILLNKTDDKLKSGMFAKGTLRFLQKENALFINKSAVLELNGKQYAFVLGEDRKAHRKVIRPGIHNADNIEIAEGVKAGERVITDNVTRLREGIPVSDLGKKDEEK